MTDHISRTLAQEIANHHLSLSEEISCFEHWRSCSRCQNLLRECMSEAGFVIKSNISPRKVFVEISEADVDFQIICSEKGVLSVSIIKNHFRKAENRVRAKGLKIVGAQLPLFGVKLLSDLKRYFNEGRAFQLPEIDTILISSSFSLQVLYWTWLIPFGKVASYMEIAEWMGKPKATRAVGGALKRNPLPIVIPCHRVIGSRGKLTGFAGGIELKRKLLELEGSIGEITL